MKKLKLAIGVLAFGLLVGAETRLAAFPLKLTSVTGTITTTATYGANATTTSNLASKVSVTLNHVITVLSNEVFLDLGTAAPPDMHIVLDPYTGGLYLTNGSGFHYDIKGNGLGNFRIRDVATSFNTATTVEQDAMVVDLGFNGREPNGQSFEFDLRTSARFKFTVNASGLGTVNLSGKGGVGYGEVNSSDSGVSFGSFTATGSGVPEWSGPFSVYWWNNF